MNGPAGPFRMFPSPHRWDVLDKFSLKTQRICQCCGRVEVCQKPLKFPEIQPRDQLSVSRVNWPVSLSFSLTLSLPVLLLSHVRMLNKTCLGVIPFCLLMQLICTPNLKTRCQNVFQYSVLTLPACHFAFC